MGSLGGTSATGACWPAACNSLSASEVTAAPLSARSGAVKGTQPNEGSTNRSSNRLSLPLTSGLMPRSRARLAAVSCAVVPLRSNRYAVVALVHVDQAEVARRRARPAVQAHLHRGYRELPGRDGGIGGGEERGCVAVRELAERRVRGTVHAPARGEAVSVAAQGERAAVEAEPDADHGAVGQLRGDRSRGRPAAVVDHQRVVHRQRPGRRVDDRRLDEGGLRGVGFVAGTLAAVGRLQPVRRGKTLGAQRIRRYDQGAVGVGGGGPGVRRRGVDAGRWLPSRGGGPHRARRDERQRYRDREHIQHRSTAGHGVLPSSIAYPVRRPGGLVTALSPRDSP